MKILILSSQAFSLLHFRADMMKAFQAEGHEVHAAAPDNEDYWNDDLQKIGVTYHRIGLSRTGQNPISDIKGFISIRNVIKVVQPNVVFCYQAKTVIYGLLAARVCKVNERYALVAGLGSIFRNSNKSIKALILKMILSFQYRLALKCAKKVYFQNKDDAAELISRHIVDVDKIEYMNGSGVNLCAFPKTELPQIMRFLFVGRLIKDKGIIEYLEAAKVVKRAYPDVVFDVVGYYDTNPSAVKPEDIASYFDTGIATFHGKQDNVYPFLADCMVYVLPSYHEGTPKSVLEAMAVGRPIITTDAPGCRETVENGKNGFLVSVRASEPLAEKMIWMIEHPKEVASMGECSYKIACEKYDAEKVNDLLIQSMSLANRYDGGYSNVTI